MSDEVSNGLNKGCDIENSFSFLIHAEWRLPQSNRGVTSWWKTVSVKISSRYIYLYSHGCLVWIIIPWRFGSWHSWEEEINSAHASNKRRSTSSTTRLGGFLRMLTVTTKSYYLLLKDNKQSTVSHNEGMYGTHCRYWIVIAANNCEVIRQCKGSFGDTAPRCVT